MERDLATVGKVLRSTIAPHGDAMEVVKASDEEGISQPARSGLSSAPFSNNPIVSPDAYAPETADVSAAPP